MWGLVEKNMESEMQTGDIWLVVKIMVPFWVPYILGAVL